VFIKNSYSGKWVDVINEHEENMSSGVGNNSSQCRAVLKNDRA
jgi:hypothetical protein